MSRLTYLVTHPMTARYLLRGQLRFMVDAGWTVILITSSGSQLDGIGTRENVAVQTVDMARGMTPLRDLRSLAGLWRQLRRLRPEIVNAGTPKAGLLGMIAAAAARVPVRIYTLRGLRLETSRGMVRRTLAVAERLACRLATEVVCVSPSLRRAAVELGVVHGSKCVVLGSGSSNGVDIRRFRPRPGEAALRSGLGIPASAPVVGFIGRLTRDKGIEELRRAFQDLLLPTVPDVRLLLVGDFEPGDPVSSDSRRLLLSHPQVVATGFVEDTAPYYSLMDVLAFPSHREGLPNAPLEAAASGVPVAGFRATGTVDAVVEGETGLLAAVGDVNELGQALLAYLSSAELRRQHGALGRRRIEMEFRQEKVWGAWDREYRRLLSIEHAG